MKNHSFLPGGQASMDNVQEALVQCHELWRRSPGAGRWPFAGDGPWHLMQGEDGDFGGDGVDGVSSSARPRGPLDAGEVAQRDAVTAWLGLLDDPFDRRMVHLATTRLHAGEGHVPWGALKRWLRYDRTSAALAWRYRQALAVIVCRLNDWPMHRRMKLASEGFADRGDDGAQMVAQ